MEEEKRRAKRYIYIGETNRSAYERGIEHQNDIQACKTSSHMLRHLIDQHEEEEEDWEKIRFGMKILKATTSAFKRQIVESVLIQKERNNHILNSKAEYNRCAIPRLTCKLGEKELTKWRVEDKIEQAKEATIEEKIRIRKKEKAKRRAEKGRRMEKGQPARKRRKANNQPEEDILLGSEEGNELEQEEEQPKIRASTPKKRSMQGKQPRAAKKKRMNYDIKRYISCKKWREEEQAEADNNIPSSNTTIEDEQTGTTMEDHIIAVDDKQAGKPGADPSCIVSMQDRMPTPNVWAS